MMNIRSLKKNRSKALPEARGAVAIEAILSILTVLFVIFWTFEIVMAVYYYAVLSNAAREGVRYAVVHGSNNSNCSGTPKSGVSTSCASPDASAANVKSQVQNYAGISGLTVNVTYPDGNNTPPSRVRVFVSTPIVTYFASLSSFSFNATAQGRIVN
jgi:hypothetical protein